MVRKQVSRQLDDIVSGGTLKYYRMWENGLSRGSYEIQRRCFIDLLPHKSHMLCKVIYYF